MTPRSHRLRIGARVYYVMKRAYRQQQLLSWCCETLQKHHHYCNLLATQDKTNKIRSIPKVYILIMMWFMTHQMHCQSHPYKFHSMIGAEMQCIDRFHSIENSHHTVLNTSRYIPFPLFTWSLWEYNIQRKQRALTTHQAGDFFVVPGCSLSSMCPSFVAVALYARFYHIETWRKLPSFYRRHLNVFSVIKVFVFWLKFKNFVLEDPFDSMTVFDSSVLGNSLAPNRHWTNAWTNSSHNGRAGLSSHQPHDCWLKCLFRRRSKKTSKLRVTGLCDGNSSGTGEFPAQMASNAENVSIWWFHHGFISHR